MIITALISEKAKEIDCQIARIKIKEEGFKNLDVPREDMTVEFPIGRATERILVTVETRAEKYFEESNRLHAAELIGSIIEDTFGAKIEVKFLVLGQEFSSVYLS